MTTELAKRAVACTHWRWMQGMATIDDDIVVEATYSGDLRVFHHDYTETEPIGWALPDLDDPATLGCLLHLVRKKYIKGASVIMGGDRWYYVISIGVLIASGDSEAEALVAALEAVQ